MDPVSMALMSGVFGIGGKFLDRFLNRQDYGDSIQRKVEDAKRAGINPLAALGHTYNAPASEVGGAVGEMGQNIARAAAANGKNDDPRAARLADLAEKHAELQNKILVAQLANMRDSQTKVPPSPEADLASKFKPTATGLKAGLLIKPNPSFGDVQEVQNRYGDFWGDVIGGPITLAADINHNLGRYREELYRMQRSRNLRSTFDDRFSGIPYRWMPY